MHRTRSNTSRSRVAVQICAMALSAAAHADTVTLTGLTNDFSIRLPEGNSPFFTGEGINGNQRLGVFRETRNPPMGRPEAEGRSILEFDLSLLGLADISSAAFSVFVPDQNSAIQTHAADLWGSGNRAAVVNYQSPGAASEYDAADYALIRAGAIPSFNPTQDNQRYESGVTAYLQARYNDYLMNPANRFVLFRLQVAPSVGNVNAFYEVSASGFGAATDPQLIITGNPVVLVPLPLGAWAGLGGLAVVGGMRASRRKRSEARTACASM